MPFPATLITARWSTSGGAEFIKTLSGDVVTFVLDREPSRLGAASPDGAGLGPRRGERDGWHEEARWSDPASLCVGERPAAGDHLRRLPAARPYWQKPSDNRKENQVPRQVPVGVQRSKLAQRAVSVF
jgi:hypothetical protein